MRQACGKTHRFGVNAAIAEKVLESNLFFRVHVSYYTLFDEIVKLLNLLQINDLR
jgi:hypothetical protein